MPFFLLNIFGEFSVYYELVKVLGDSFDFRVIFEEVTFTHEKAKFLPMLIFIRRSSHLTHENTLNGNNKCHKVSKRYNVIPCRFGINFE